MTDGTARWIGRGSLSLIVATVASSAVFAFMGDKRSSKYDGVVWVALFFVACLAWLSAYVAMQFHLRHSPSISEADAEEWSHRQEARLGFVVPFLYLLGSADQRRITKYLHQTRGRRA